MSKITIYGKRSAIPLETINNTEDYYFTNVMFYVKAEGKEYYFTLEAISMIRVEPYSEKEESEVNADDRDSN